MPVSLTVVGSINLDLVASCERLPRPGETLTGATFERIPGGKGANQAVAAARRGADVTMVGRVGNDPFATEALTGLEDAGVSLDLERSGQTGIAVIVVAVDERADLVVANRYERESLGADPGLLAVTLGAEGAVLLEGGVEVARAQPPPVEAVDGTAAGDAFTACLVGSLLEGRERGVALVRACAAGAVAASRFGAQRSLPSAAEVDAILARA